MINMEGFRRLVTAVGGVELNVRDRIPIGRIGDIKGYIEPGKRKLNGFETLWFARSRADADDYSRMARQRCVMNAMLQQLSPKTVVFRFEKIAKASESMFSTDLPASEVGRFMDLAMKARTQPVRTVSFVPPMVNTSDPDIDKIQAAVEKAVDPPEKSEKAKKKKARAARNDSAGTTGGSIGTLREGYAANQAKDLSSAC